jgi:hypothetical protein
VITAFVDESGRYCKDDDGVYVLAAVLVDAEHPEGVRDALIAMCIARTAGFTGAMRPRRDNAISHVR